MPPRKKSAEGADEFDEGGLPDHRVCATDEVNERLLRSVPGYAATRSAIETRTIRVMALGDPAVLRDGCTEIPLVVHVLYRNAEENIPQEQVESQIAVLNADFRAANADRASTPPVFQPLIGDARVTFKLATTDPDGNPTDGITRTASNATEFRSSTDNAKHTATGGHDAWPSDRYLNVWTCGNLLSGDGQSLLGYAQFPGGPADTDGVVILHSAFGTTGTARAPFNLGRTTTHEVGHWLNLRHIWGDDGTGCSGSDFVPDTPNQGGPNYGSPTFPTVSCGNGPNGDLFMNYMDYVDDAAMYMFTQGQVARMQAALDGPRASIGTTGPCGKTTVKDLPKDPPKEFPKDPPKELPKDPPKEFPKDPPKELPKDPPKEFPKDPPKELPKDPPKDFPKDRPKEFAKDLASDLPKWLRDGGDKSFAVDGPVPDPGPWGSPGPWGYPGPWSYPGPWASPVLLGPGAGPYPGQYGAQPFVLGTGRGDSGGGCGCGCGCDCGCAGHGHGAHGHGAHGHGPYGHGAHGHGHASPGAYAGQAAPAGQGDDQVLAAVLQQLSEINALLARLLQR